jgi:hypothetical protein
MRLPHQKYIDSFFDSFESTEYRTILVHRGRCNLEAILEMLCEQHADEHNAALPPMNYRNTILYSYAGILCAARLACEYRVDSAAPFSLFYFTRHNISLP